MIRVIILGIVGLGMIHQAATDDIAGTIAAAALWLSLSYAYTNDEGTP